MKLEEFNYSFPDELIAEEPLLERDKARLLCVGNSIQHNQVCDLPDILRSGDLLVMNNTKVLPARLFVNRETGGAVEILLLEESEGCWRALVNSSKKLRRGEELLGPDGVKVTVIDPTSPALIKFPEDINLFEYLNKVGHVPLPPYIKRADRDRDKTQYQTIYAEIPGAVAAPTTGLHFTPSLLSRLDRSDIGLEYITLHVGLGTFQPIRVEDVTQHKMHEERYEISEYTWNKIKEAERVVVVGTTTVRALESAAASGNLSGRTDLFITPGYDFSVVDCLMTNFHQPKSSLMVLVSAFCGDGEG